MEELQKWPAESGNDNTRATPFGVQIAKQLQETYMRRAPHPHSYEQRETDFR